MNSIEELEVINNRVRKTLDDRLPNDSIFDYVGVQENFMLEEDESLEDLKDNIINSIPGKSLYGLDDLIENTVDEITKIKKWEVMELLNIREQRVLDLRFGLGISRFTKDGRSRTYEEVGREFGLSRERIRQIEAKALRKLKYGNGYWSKKDRL